MAVYVETLERLEKIRLSRLCPGHGDVIDEPKARIREYIEHRRAREDQIYKLVKKQPAKIPDLVSAIYTGDDLPPELIEAAAWQVQAHLVKLKKAGKVTGSGAKSVWAAV
jgi:hydroxyacylglutathione hydrolase